MKVEDKPETSSVVPDAMLITAVLEIEPLPLTASVPLLIVVLLVYVFVPESVQVPEPALTTLLTEVGLRSEMLPLIALIPRLKSFHEAARGK